MTIFGVSAGGAIVTYLMSSPLTKGLFHRAIAQSGANLDAWAQPAHVGVAAKRATKLADILGCERSDDWKFTIDCLRNASARDIAIASYDFYVSLFLRINEHSKHRNYGNNYTGMGYRPDGSVSTSR